MNGRTSRAIGVASVLALFVGAVLGVFDARTAPRRAPGPPVEPSLFAHDVHAPPSQPDGWDALTGDAFTIELSRPRDQPAVVRAEIRCLSGERRFRPAFSRRLRPVEAGARIRARFRGRANAPLQIDAILDLRWPEGSPVHDSVPIDLDAKWQTFELEFLARAAAPRPMLSFSPPCQSVTIELADVEADWASPDEPAWPLWRLSTGESSAKFARCEPEQCRVENCQGAQPDKVLVRRLYAAFAPRRPLLLSFRARADAARPINVFVQHALSSEHLFALNDLSIDQHWQTIRVLLPTTDESALWLNIGLGASAAAVEIAAPSIAPQDASTGWCLPPTPHARLINSAEQPHVDRIEIAAVDPTVCYRRFVPASELTGPIELSFRARSDAPRTVAYHLSKRETLRENLGWGWRELPLTPEWQDFHFTIEPTRAADAWLQFDLGGSTVAVEFAGLRLAPRGQPRRE